MEIKISLPQCPPVNTYKDLTSYLKQLELAVHHAQKSIEHAEKDGVEITDNAFIIFSHPSLGSNTLADGKKENNSALENFTDNYYEELQDIELHLNLA